MFDAARDKALSAVILDDPNRANVKGRLGYMYRNGEIGLDHLIQAGVDSDIVEYVVGCVRPVCKRRTLQ